MREYDVLKCIFESNEGAQPKDMSKKLETHVSNIYTYLKKLGHEGLVQRMQNGSYMANQDNVKLSQILDLKAMAPGKFHRFITPSFGGILAKLCEKLRVERSVFAAGEINQIEHLAIPSRIVLKLSKRPIIYCLKINESLVASLLAYHDITPNFNLIEFNKVIESINLKRMPSASPTSESEPEVIKICDQAYADNLDIYLLMKMKDFAPDERLNELLKNVDRANKEYHLFLNAVEPNIRKAISEQWEKRYIYNTNSIEGNTMSEKEVVEYLKNGKPQGHVSKRELHETTNIRHAFEFLKLKRNEGISEELIREIHFMIHKDIGDAPGEYKKFYNYVKPSSPTTPPQHVKERMRLLLQWYNENRGKLHPFVLASVFHMQFEMIHPFADGNGRVGRLLMNYILEERDFLPLTILEKTKQNYYRSLENKSIQQFLDYVLTSFIEEYRR